eukprot:TRINITY_DN28378_c0_g1_i1.p1 TRINITY_DN28378_c0_g1~~TRINITY_DN28378_c0_g1_i1.p1  ORF type:complete len:125 (+),score=28.17 TRINITY_DN28378_c0_g1_i1:44-418(+)
MLLRQVLLLSMGVGCAVFGAASVMTTNQQTIPHGVVSCCCGCVYILLLHVINNDLQRAGMMVPLFMLLGVFSLYQRGGGGCSQPDNVTALKVKNKELAEQWNSLTAAHVLMAAELEKLQNEKKT